MENIITKFQTIFSTIKLEKNSNFYLFMVLKMDEYTDKWSVVVSAPWMTSENSRESFNYIAQKITQVLTKEEVSNLARIGVFQPNEHLITLVTQTIRIQDAEPMKIENTKLNGYTIHEAYIFESIPPQTTN